MLCMLEMIEDLPVLWYMVVDPDDFYLRQAIAVDLSVKIMSF